MTTANQATVVVHIRWSDDGQHIRKWARDPFEGSQAFVLNFAPVEALAEEMARAIFEADAEVGMTWAAFLALAEREPDFLQNVEHVRCAARAAALARSCAAVERLEVLATQVLAYDSLLRSYAGPLSNLCDGDCPKIDAAYDALVAAAAVLKSSTVKVEGFG